MEKDVFARAKAVCAVEVAQQAGLHLQQRGKRQWACCPIHGERTPSLCFYPDGGWHCYGCGQGGDAADLYAALHGISSLDAARALTGDQSAQYRPRVKSEGQRLKELLEAYRWQEYGRLCRILHQSGAALSALEGRGKPPAELAEDTLFCTVMEAYTEAQDAMERLLCMPEEALLEVMQCPG